MADNFENYYQAFLRYNFIDIIVEESNRRRRHNTFSDDGFTVDTDMHEIHGQYEDVNKRLIKMLGKRSQGVSGRAHGLLEEPHTDIPEAIKKLMNLIGAAWYGSRPADWRPNSDDLKELTTLVMEAWHEVRDRFEDVQKLVNVIFTWYSL